MVCGGREVEGWRGAVDVGVREAMGLWRMEVGGGAFGAVVC